MCNGAETVLSDTGRMRLRLIMVAVPLCATLVTCSAGGRGDTERSDERSADGSAGVNAADHSLPRDCPTADDIGARLGDTVELELDAPGADAEVECTYSIGPLSGDGSAVLMAWRLPPDEAAERSTDYLLERYAPPSVFGEPEPLDLGDEGLVSRFSSAIESPAVDGGLYGHDAFAIVHAGDRLCLGSYNSVVSAPEPRQSLEETFIYILGGMCSG
jgi:hypothetical protein